MFTASGDGAGRRMSFGRSFGIFTATVLFYLLSWSGPGCAYERRMLGPFGPEGPRMREQLWITPSGDPNRMLRATVFRPAEGSDLSNSKPRPLAVINHGTSDLTRLSVAMPVFYWLSRWFVERGYVVVLPQRRGHGATGGTLAESVGSCTNPDHFVSGEIAADDIEAVLTYMRRQPTVASDRTVVVGISTGGWASLALASRNPAGVQAVLNFAGGRGGHAGGKPNAVCGEAQLIEAAGDYGRTARVPTMWLYARNDSYFGPKLARSMFDAWIGAGGAAELQILPSYGVEGHSLGADRAGWQYWGPAVDRFLNAHTAATPHVATKDSGSSPERMEPRLSPISPVNGGQPTSFESN